MPSPEDEAIKLFSDLIELYEAVTYPLDQEQVNMLLRQAQEAILLTFGEESKFYEEFLKIKLNRNRAQPDRKEHYFYRDRDWAIGIMKGALVNLRLYAKITTSSQYVYH